MNERRAAVSSIAVSTSKSSARRSSATKVGKYTLAQSLGKGGFGEVYAGSQKSGPRVALKLLDADHSRDDEAVERFKREAETAKRLDHPSIVRVLDIGSSRNRHYIAMELVHGGSLKALMQRELDHDRASKVLSVLAESASGLAYAHEHGVVHRDVKPANILLTRSGKAKVADFGLARAVDHASMTTEGKVLGTAAYMSPEQARGKRATSASDVYSMGIILYEVATGTLPFQSDTQLGFLYQHAEMEPPQREVRAPFPQALVDVALACLAKAPDDRPSMSRVAELVGAIELARGRRWLWPVVALVIAAIIAVVVFILAS